MHLPRTVVEEIKSVITATANKLDLKDGSKLVVRIQPGQLGELKVEVIRQDGTIKAVIHVQSEQAKSAVDHALSGFKNNAENLDSSLSHLQVVVDRDGRSSDYRNEYEQKADHFGGSDAKSSEEYVETGEDEDRAPTTWYRGYNTIEMTA